MHVDAPCPACDKLGLDVAFHIHKIPYFGDVMENVISCPSCGYRHADVIILEAKEPVRYTLKVESEELLTRIKKIKAGKDAMHLIIEDPTGNSIIISDKVLKERA